MCKTPDTSFLGDVRRAKPPPTRALPFVFPASRCCLPLVFQHDKNTVFSLRKTLQSAVQPLNSLGSEGLAQSCSLESLVLW